MKTEKSKRQRKITTWLNLPVLTLMTLCFVAGHTAWANPKGAQVVNGAVSINTQGNVLTVTNSPNAIINWQSFSIHANETTRFIQQGATSAVLNRITGQDPSMILGALQSNGRVFLLNPNGILFGQGSHIDVNGLVASTLHLSNSDFLAGNYHFTAGSSAGSIQNQGTITTPGGGQVYLIAPDIENTGIINAPQGNVLLAAGHSVQLVDSSDPEIAVVFSAPADKAVNLGQILAAGGSIGIYAGLIRQCGIVNADSAVIGENGQITFKATQKITLDEGSLTSASGVSGGNITLQSATGSTVVSGTVQTKGSHGKGGTVQVLGNEVGMNGNALIDVSGRTGGGTALIGGDYQGRNSAIQNAEATYVEPNAIIKADALVSGNGGKVIVWSDGDTSFAGTITARGGSFSGDGGFVETSGHKLTISGTAFVDTGAKQGQTGSWLLDPTDLTIATGGGDITGATLSNNLATTDVTILNSSGAGGIDGDIFVNDTVSWTSSHTLTLNAYRNIEINNTITGGGNLVLRADSTGTGAGTVTFAGYGAVTLTGGAASVYYNPSGGYASPTVYSGNFTLNGGATLTAYMLVNNINDLQAINNNLSGTYALGKDIDAVATTTWNSGRGFIPIGRADTGDAINAIPLTFDGNGHTISNLFINRPSQQYIGLFGGNGSPTIRYLWLENVNVTGGFQTAGAIAHTDGVTSYSYVTGTVHGTSITVGGLIALNAGQIDNCYSTAAVTGGSWVGGLVGANWGTSAGIANSYSTGTVTGSGSYIGGLIGGLSTGAPASLVTNSFWDTESSGRSLSGAGTGLTTAAMKQQASFGSWDFTTTWAITENVTYPYLLFKTTAATEVTETATIPGAVENSLYVALNTSVSGVTGETSGSGDISGNNTTSGGGYSPSGLYKEKDKDKDGRNRGTKSQTLPYCN